MDRLNAWLDTLPRTRFGARTQEVPAFRSIGVAGFYLALAVTIGSGLATGRSVVVLAIVAVVCGLSFFAWALVRRFVTGRETLVLFEHVWFALACSTVVLVALGAPIEAHLDTVVLGLCAFLSAGRIGCLVVGCCHGQPSIVGITYRSEAVDDGFPSELVGVRLFPVQLLESIGLAAIGLTGLIALPFVPAGTVFVWFLVGYALLRFGTEGLRGDERLSFAGLSVARWGAIAQGAVGLVLADRDRAVGPMGASLVVALVALIGFAAIWRRTHPRRPLRDARQLADIRRFIDIVARGESPSGAGPTAIPHAIAPAIRTFAGGLTVAVSTGDRGPGDVHVSFALPADHQDRSLLGDVAAATVPESDRDATRSGANGSLHVFAFLPLRPAASVDPVRSSWTNDHVTEIDPPPPHEAAPDHPQTLNLDGLPGAADDGRWEYFTASGASAGSPPASA